ncbi:hypothetical protein N7470_009807 [Penicillium chermesinum]|nr:hypothetical protein N7470_009807 [Penicillium chermesinum]
MSGKTVIAFDVYGTLLSTESISSKLEAYFERTKAQSISALWRRYQLEYTWRLNCMERYENFSIVTKNSLQHALADHGEQLSDGDIADLMEAYDSLSAFPDVTPALNRIGNDPNLHAVIFSNGTQEMISNSVRRSKELSQHASKLHDFVSVEDVQRFKPARASYASLAEKVGSDQAR